MNVLRRLRTALTDPGRITWSDGSTDVCTSSCRADAQRRRTALRAQDMLRTHR